jgi:hypothetical protein
MPPNYPHCLGTLTRIFLLCRHNFLQYREPKEREHLISYFSTQLNGRKILDPSLRRRRPPPPKHSRPAAFIRKTVYTMVQSGELFTYRQLPWEDVIVDRFHFLLNVTRSSRTLPQHQMIRSSRHD